MAMMSVMTMMAVTMTGVTSPLILALVESLVLIESLTLGAPALVLIEALISRQDQPGLIASIVSVPLDHSCAIVGISSFDINALSSKSSDNVALVGVLSSVVAFDSKPAASVFSGIGSNLCSIIRLVIEHTETSVGGLHDKGIFITLWHDEEALAVVTGVVSNGEAVVVTGNSEGFRVIKH